MDNAKRASIIDRPLLSALDRRKRNRVLARAIALEILKGGDQRLTQLDLELVPTNRVMERWAAGSGDDLPSEPWDDSRKSRLSPLDGRTHTVVDQIYLRAPFRYHDFARRWWCGTGAVVTLANELGLSRAGVYLELRCTLFYFKGEFERSGHKDLLGLLEKVD